MNAPLYLSLNDHLEAWKPSAARLLLDMEGELEEFKQLGQEQLEDALVLLRMILAHGVGYLANEVGTGKTYVALALTALMRHLQPGLKVLYVTPSGNVLEKWYEREMPAFFRDNVIARDLRVKGPDGEPLVPPVACRNVDEWIRAAVRQPAALDTVVSFTSLSFNLTESPEDSQKKLDKLAALAGRPPIQMASKYAGELAAADAEKTQAIHERIKAEIKAEAARLVNKVIPVYDLVVVDEAHLLKHGADAGADRVQFLARALGADSKGERRFRGALLMSGTPFDRDLLQLANQLEIFARDKSDQAPYVIAEEQARQRRLGVGWGAVQQQLKHFMVRRVQALKINGQWLSRNQYRVEQRAEAGIRLTDTDPATLKARLFMAILQKRLTECLDNVNGGRLPRALLASFEGYDAGPQIRKRKEEAKKRAPDATAIPNALDTERRKAGEPLDGRLIEDIVKEFHHRFKNEELPHPKLQHECKYLFKAAFHDREKQLTFVQRLRSVDDLFFGLNKQYDEWLSGYFGQEGLLDVDVWHAFAKAHASGTPREEAQESEANARHGTAGKPTGPVTYTLFSYLFRSDIAETPGARFLDGHNLPMPGVLLRRLTEPDRHEALTGELDWRSFILLASSCPDPIDREALAKRAAGKGNGTVNRYRRLQLAWVELMWERTGCLDLRLGYLREHLKTLVETGKSDKDDEISLDMVTELQDAPTFGLRLYIRQHGDRVLPDWRRVWDALPDLSPADAAYRLLHLDLHAEVMFSLLRLDHPFIDLYIAWALMPLEEQSDSRAVADRLVARVADLFERGQTGFCTVSVLEDLADAWPQIAKTNFARFLKGINPVPRTEWRGQIRRLLTSFSPIAWASGQNTEQRPAIARSFRMPGYPMVLIATSVLQEGEDLHVCCRQVTHFGTTGSPIGIEQKNGRVDRVGSRAQRLMLAGKTVEEGGISVRFPHLVETFEWYQIRELCMALNDYLRSMHQLQSEPGQDEKLVDVVADDRPIPPLLTDHLESPFKPVVDEDEPGIGRRHVEQDLKVACQRLGDALLALQAVAEPLGFHRVQPGRDDAYAHESGCATLSLHASPFTGKLFVQARRVCGDAYVDANGRIQLGEEDGKTPWADGNASKRGVWAQGDAGKFFVSDRLQWHCRSGDDDGLHGLRMLGRDAACARAWNDSGKASELSLVAACFLSGDPGLDQIVIRELVARLGLYDTPTVLQQQGDTPWDMLDHVLSKWLELHGEGRFERVSDKRGVLRSVGGAGKKTVYLRMRLVGHLIVVWRILEKRPRQEYENIANRTLHRNAAYGGLDFYYNPKGNICARLVCPLACLTPLLLDTLFKELESLPVVS